MPTPSSKIRSIDLTSQIMGEPDRVAVGLDHIVLHVGGLALFPYTASAIRQLHVQRAVPKLPECLLGYQS